MDEERMLEEQEERSDQRLITEESKQESRLRETLSAIEPTIHLEDLLGDFSEQTGASFG